MQLIVPNVTRYAVHQSMAGRPIVNIIDMFHEPDDPVAASREDACHDVAGDILNNWHDHILPIQVNQLQALSVSWVDLDSADGPVGSRSSTSDKTWPSAGTNVGHPLPGHTAVRVIKDTEGGRQSRKGRMYLAGLDEGQTGAATPNTINSGYVAAINGRFSDFLDGISDTDITQSTNRYPVVVHVPKNGTPWATRLTGFAVDPLLGSQRRRLRG